jgi:hypothetical protein
MGFLKMSKSHNTNIGNQNLSLMDKEELIALIDEEFFYLWNLYINKEEDFDVNQPLVLDVDVLSSLKQDHRNILRAFNDATPSVHTPTICIDSFENAKKMMFKHEAKENELICQTLQDAANDKLLDIDIAKSFKKNINEVMSIVKDFPYKDVLNINETNSHALFCDYKKLLEIISERFLLEEDVIFSMYNMVKLKL